TPFPHRVALPILISVPQYNRAVIYEPPPPYYGAYAPATGLMTFGVGFAAGAATAYACNWSGSSGNVTVNNNYHYSSTNNYSASQSTPHYHSTTAPYHAHDP